MAQNAVGKIQTLWTTPFLSVTFSGSSFHHFQKVFIGTCLTSSPYIFVFFHSLVCSGLLKPVTGSRTLALFRFCKDPVPDNRDPESTCGVFDFLTVKPWSEQYSAKKGLDAYRRTVFSIYQLAAEVGCADTSRKMLGSCTHPQRNTHYA